MATRFSAETYGRLDAAVRAGLETSHSQARRAIQTGKVRVNGQRQLDIGTFLRAGDVIDVDYAAPDPRRTEPFGVQLVYRDDHLLILDKPAGLLSAPLPDGDPDEPTALGAADKLCHGLRNPKGVHRLDKLTSGLLMFARSTAAARALREAIDTRQVKRVYRCVVHGYLEEREAMISSMLIRDTGTGRRGSRPGSYRVRPVDMPDPGPKPGYGKLAITRYRVVAEDEGRSALEVRLSTGRTHQIRIHLAELGHPVVGESVYARTGDDIRQALHAAKLELTHPITGTPLQFESRWPADLAYVTPTGEGW